MENLPKFSYEFTVECIFDEWQSENAWAMCDKSWASTGQFGMTGPKSGLEDKLHVGAEVASRT